MLQSLIGGNDGRAVASCHKVESVVSSDATEIKRPTDVILIADVLQRCSQLLATHDQVRSST